jgi:CRISPR system Cascade subunit CasA
MSAFSLVHGAWIPVRLADGTVKSIAPFEITSQHDTNPIVAFAWPRPDFDLASHEFLIGLLAAIYPADLREPKQWVRLFHEPPSPAELEVAFAPFADAFNLDGEGPRFLQDFDALDGEELPIDSLFIEAPGANTIKLNKDLFVKRGQSRVLSRAAAAMALYTLQQFAPSGGAGHRTSLRGGGPLVTLALPDGGQGSHPTLWQRLWLNIPADLRLNPSEMPQAFPWLARTQTSTKKETVHEAGAHKLQAFFGMPRRIRLVFAENVARLPCDLTGACDEIICTGFTAAPWGVNYGIWKHPTTPYYRPKANSNDPALPVHAPEGRLGYRQWLGFVLEGETAQAASAILNAKKRLTDLGRPWRDDSRLLAGGYAMDNMKALAFAEAEMPLHRLDPELAKDVENFARLMVNAASVAAKILGISLKRARYGPKAEIKVDSTILETPRERFWEITEDDFHKTLDAALTSLAEDPEGDEQEKLARTWRGCLEHAALGIFDDTAPIESFDELEPEDVVEGRKFLVLSSKGYGKLGADFFKALRLEPPESKKKSGGTSKGKSTAEISQ